MSVELPAVGTALKARYKGQEYRATIVLVEDKPQVAISDRPESASFTSLSAAGHAITGTSVNGHRFWQIEGEAPVRTPRSRGKSAAPAPEAKNNGHTVPAGPRMIKVITRTPNQKALAEGQTRWFCNACMEGFVVEGTGKEVPSACPKGHTAEAEA